MDSASALIGLFWGESKSMHIHWNFNCAPICFLTVWYCSLLSHSVVLFATYCMWLCSAENRCFTIFRGCFKSALKKPVILLWKYMYKESTAELVNETSSLLHYSATILERIGILFFSASFKEKHCWLCVTPPPK